MTRWMSVMLAVGSCFAAADARADDAAVIAVGGSPGLGALAWDAAVVAVASDLEGLGYAMPPGGVRTRAQSPADCVTDGCLTAERERTGAAVLAVVSVFAAEQAPGEAGSVVVTLVSARGSFDGTVTIEGGAVELAARRALGEARRRMERGGVPWLIVRGRPAGALVLLDGVEQGVLPWEGEVQPGTHGIAVRLSGYESFARDVEVSVGEPIEIDVDLSSLVASGDAWPSFVLGAGLLAVGIGLTIPSWITLAQDGQCVETDALGCREFFDVDGRTAAWLAVGGALAVTGVVMLFTQPIIVSASASDQGASVALRGSF